MKEDIFHEKVNDIINDHDNFEEIEHAREEFRDFTSKPVHLTRPTSDKTQFLFAFDNLGLDNQMTVLKRKQLFDLVKKLKFHAEQKELIALLNDVDHHIRCQREFPQELVNTIEQDEEVEIDEKLNALDDDKEDFKNSHFLEMYEQEFVSWDNQGSSNHSSCQQRSSSIFTYYRNLHSLCGTAQKSRVFI